MIITFKRKPATQRIGHCAGMARGYCTPLSRGGRSIQYNLVAAGDCEGMRAWREWSDAWEGILNHQTLALHLVSANRIGGSHFHRTTIYPTTTWDCTTSSVYHRSVAEREAKSGVRPTLSKQQGSTSGPYLTHNQTSGLNPRSHQHPPLQPQKTGIPAVCVRVHLGGPI